MRLNPGQGIGGIAVQDGRRPGKIDLDANFLQLIGGDYLQN